MAIDNWSELFDVENDGGEGLADVFIWVDDDDDVSVACELDVDKEAAATMLAHSYSFVVCELFVLVLLLFVVVVDADVEVRLSMLSTFVWLFCGILFVVYYVLVTLRLYFRLEFVWLFCVLLLMNLFCVCWCRFIWLHETGKLELNRPIHTHNGFISFLRGYLFINSHTKKWSSDFDCV